MPRSSAMPEAGLGRDPELSQKSRSPGGRGHKRAEAVQWFEARGGDPKLSTTIKWRRALQKAGCILIEPDAEGGPGVRLREPKGWAADNRDFPAIEVLNQFIGSGDSTRR